MYAFYCPIHRHLCHLNYYFILPFMDYRLESIASILTQTQLKFVYHRTMVPYTFSILKKHEQKSRAYKFCQSIFRVNGLSANFQFHKGRPVSGTIFSSLFLLISFELYYNFIFNFSAFGPDGNSVIGKSNITAWSMNEIYI